MNKDNLKNSVITTNNLTDLTKDKTYILTEKVDNHPVGSLISVDAEGTISESYNPRELFKDDEYLEMLSAICYDVIDEEKLNQYWKGNIFEISSTTDKTTRILRIKSSDLSNSSSILLKDIESQLKSGEKVTGIIKLANQYSIANFDGWNDRKYLKHANVNNITTLTGYGFNTCSQLTSVSCDNVINYCAAAFAVCSSLSSIKISKAKSFTTSTFEKCSNLSVIDMSEITAIPTLPTFNEAQSGWKIFLNTGSNVGGVKIYVPDSLYDSWIADTNWTKYRNYFTNITICKVS